jgi:Family of unknown function (DUF6221)/Bacterial regulatory proteins, luxR family
MHSSSMGEIHEFILGRIDDDASAARASLHRHALREPLGYPGPSGLGSNWGPDRVLTECEIKNEIVSAHDDGACSQCVANPDHGCETMRLLARAWSDHASYRTDWSSFHDGDAQISASRATDILEVLSHPDCLPVVKLTERETEVLRLIAEGGSYPDIGKALFISPNTVKNHARNSVHKSQFHRRRGNSPGPAGSPA